MWMGGYAYAYGIEFMMEKMVFGAYLCKKKAIETLQTRKEALNTHL